MKPVRLCFLLIAAFFITSAGICTSKDSNCHSFGVEIYYDGIEQLSSQVKNGTAPFTYKWANGYGAASNITIPTSPATYSLTVTDFSGCQAIATYTVK
ncbi:MAG TPA: hypothetical protein VK590_03465 [Saprospiraceae bacterium]|nr:hypothetical protein [Saprospiraceae bacterium]